MRLDTLEKLCCAFDKSDLNITVVTKDLDEHIVEGILHCPQCNRVFPIVSGIPIMSPDEYREFTIEQPLLQRWTNNGVAENFRLLETTTAHAE